MNTKTNVSRFTLAAVASLTGLLVGVGIHSATSQGVHVMPAGSEVGRYQIVAAGTGSAPYVYFLDTKTGRCWMQNTPGLPWQRAASPTDTVR